MDKFGKIGIILVIVGTLANFYWNSSRVKVDGQDPREETWVDQQGQLHVLGLTLNVTTLREAEIALMSRSDSALYLYPHKDDSYHLVLEAFFPSITDHSKVILGLAASEELLLQLESRATPPRLNPNGVGRMNLANVDLAPVQQLPIVSVRLIPSAQLEVAVIEQRFGKAKQVVSGPDQLSLMLYPDIGLQVVLREEGKDELNFFHPATFVESARELLVHEKIDVVL